MADTKPQTGKPVPPADVNGSEPGPDCRSCGDKKTVSLPMEGALGPILREVACPDCQNGVTLNKGPQYEDLDTRLTLLGVAVLVLAVGMALFVWTYRKELEDYMDGFASTAAGIGADNG